MASTNDGLPEGAREATLAAVDPFAVDNLWDQLAMGLIAVDRGNIVRAVNTSAERIMGRPRGALVGVSLNRLLPGHPLALDLVERCQRLAMPCRVRKAQLSPGPREKLAVSLTAIPLVNTAGGPMFGAVLQLEEVGSVEYLEDGERLSGALDSVANLVMTVAHEVKNPLAGIRGAAQLLGMEAELPSARECTGLILAEVDRVTRLLDTLLGLGDNHPLAMAELNIHEVLDHVIRAGGSGPPLPRRNYDPSLPLVRGDRDRLVQLFLNLVTNAREAAGEQGWVGLSTRISSRIRIQGGRRWQNVVVEVTDSGPGVPPELRQRVFHPFVTTKSRGTGLGLAISQKIVHDHGGLLEIDGESQATLFRVHLPVSR
ncbi:MAG: PAS domain-containing protein [Magnetococcales bacterium]|nr:PAS domain-containing protein [Magnetococcales bacterium]